MFRFGLRTKILIRLAIMSICAMTVLILVMYRYVSTTFRDDLVQRGAFLAHTISEQSSGPILTQKFLVLSLMLHDAKEIDKDLTYLFIIDGHNEVVAHTFGDGFPTDLKTIGSGSGNSVHSIYMGDREILDISAPIGGGSLGTIHLGMSTEAIKSDLLRIFFVAAAVIVTLLCAAAGLLWLSLKRVIVDPIKTLEKNLSHVSDGNFSSIVPVVSDDEIGQLGEAFNLMGERLAVIDMQRASVIAQLHEANDKLTRIIDERERAKTLLAESEERLRLILDSAGEGIFGTDAAGRCTFCNLTSLRLLGYSGQEELIGKPIHEFLHVNHEHCDGYRSGFLSCEPIRKGERIHEYDVLFRRKDLTSFPVEYWSYPQIDGGCIVGTVVTFVDITDRKKQEEEKTRLQEMLLQSQKMDALGTLAGGIAHDFNNILAVITGYCEVGRKRCTDPVTADDLEQIMIAATRATELVRQILTFSRKSSVHHHPLELAPLIKETLKLIRSSVPATIEIIQEVDSGIVSLADPTQIHQVLLNLCTNANYAMAEGGGTLTVSLKKTDVTAAHAADDRQIPPGRYAVITVADTGCGMDQQTMLKIFEPYFTTRESGKGAGLGLAVVHGIVKSHGGRITVSSEQGRGSSFRVYLPLLAEHPVSLPDIAPEQPAEGRGERVFFVDDEEQIRDVVGRALASEGYQVEVYEEAMQVLELLRKNPNACDVLVTDMAMPGMSGKDLAAAVLSLKPDLPIILCSGYSNMSPQKAKEMGIREYMDKPLFMDTLCRRIRAIFDKSPASASPASSATPAAPHSAPD